MSLMIPLTIQTELTQNSDPFRSTELTHSDRLNSDRLN